MARPGPVGGGRYSSGRPAVRGSVVFLGGYYYDPFFGPYPWWSGPGYGYGYGYGYGGYNYNRAEVRIQATPRDAAVYVDGYYAGVVDDFDGAFQRLPLSPGGHRIELYMDGFRTIRKNMYLQTGSTLKLHETLVPLAAGETSQPPETAPAVPPPPDGTFTQPRGRTTRELPAPPPPDDQQPDQPRRQGRRVFRDGGDVRIGPDSPQGFGTLVLHVQPAEAEVSIDGQRWVTSGQGNFEVQIPAGRHRVEVELQGYQRFSSDVNVRDGGPTPLNVSLSRGQ